MTETVSAIANGLAWFFLALGLLTDGYTAFLFVHTARVGRMASGLPAVALIFYVQFCALRSALSLSCIGPLLVSLCLVHVGVQWGLPAVLERRRS